MSSRPDCAVVSTAYFPPVEYFMAAAAAGRLLIEAHDSYVKQTYRNRCRIYACDGVLSLTVPVSLPSGSRGTGGALIDYSKPWLQQHERALISAYRTSAFFEYYQDDYIPSYPAGYLDLRDAVHPKKAVPGMFRNRFRPYYQVFSDKFGFIPGLSVLDLLFNEGPDAVSYLL